MTCMLVSFYYSNKRWNEIVTVNMILKTGTLFPIASLITKSTFLINKKCPNVQASKRKTFHIALKFNCRFEVVRKGRCHL